MRLSDPMPNMRTMKRLSLCLILLLAACGREPITAPDLSSESDAAAAQFTPPVYYALAVHRSDLDFGQAGADLCGIDGPSLQAIGSITIQQTLWRVVTVGTIDVPVIIDGHCNHVVSHPVNLDITGGVVIFHDHITLNVGAEPAVDIFFEGGQMPRATDLFVNNLPTRGYRVAGLFGGATGK